MTRYPAAALAAAACALVAVRGLDPALAQRGGAGPPPPPGMSQVPGTFRSAIAMVPVDVRVFDRDGRPVSDLTQEDFAIYEDGVRQEIRHFSAQALVPGEPDGAAVRRSLRDATAADLAPARHRTFLIVLGRGRLEEPSKGLTAATRFVRERLLPQDHVAVLAYNRATDFTTAHEQIAQTLERFRLGHHAIEASLAHRVAGLAGMYGSKTIPPRLQAEVDAMFRGPGAAPFRMVPPGRVTNSGRIADDSRRALDTILNADVTASDERTHDVSLDEYLLSNAQTMTDLENIYTGIEYLRYLEGEKHLIFVTQRGLFLPRLEDDTSLAAMANDARVVLHTIQTGGISGGPDPSNPNTIGPSFPEAFAIGTLRTLAELTGGHASAYAYAEPALARIDTLTRHQYLLGYSPTNGSWDGRYRRITVRLSRPNVTTSYRQGYYGRQQLVPYNRREFLTYSRMAAAALYPEQIRDIRLKLKTTTTRAATGSEIEAEITIGIVGLAIDSRDGRHTGVVDVAAFGADPDGRSVGELWQRVDIELTDETYQRAMREGYVHRLRVPVRMIPRMFKVVVYDYRADLIGTIQVKLS